MNMTPDKLFTIGRTEKADIDFFKYLKNTQNFLFVPFNCE